MKDEALKLALEALEKAARNWPSDSVIEAITAIKQALEAPVQEPVEGYPSNWAKVTLMISPKGEMHAIGGDRVAGVGDTAYVGLERIKAAAQRQWVGLTQQDIDIAFDDTQEGGGFDDFARAIEQTLKEKNT